MSQSRNNNNSNIDWVGLLESLWEAWEVVDVGGSRARRHHLGRHLTEVAQYAQWYLREYLRQQTKLLGGIRGPSDDRKRGLMKTVDIMVSGQDDSSVEC